MLPSSTNWSVPATSASASRPLVEDLAAHRQPPRTATLARWRAQARGLRQFRLHGRDGYAYSDAQLQELAALCRGTTCCLFNNTAMIDDAARFQCLVAH